MSGSRPSSSAVVVAVVIGGGPVSVLPGSRPFDLVVAADGGYDAAIAIGLRPTHLVGDLDSITAAGLADAEAREVPVVRHPAAKDATDAELALALALALGATEIVLLGPDASDRPDQRLDHLLGALTTLGHPSLARCTSVRARLARADVTVVHPGRRVTLALEPGRVLSLLALHGPCMAST